MRNWISVIHRMKRDQGNLRHRMARAPIDERQNPVAILADRIWSVTTEIEWGIIAMHTQAQR
jgi:hypothetical protein